MIYRDFFNGVNFDLRRSTQLTAIFVSVFLYVVMIGEDTVDGGWRFPQAPASTAGAILAWSHTANKYK